jgi:NAD(P)-dependent dehydrogenase (short-subunit alcohol dehydrogenase family)
MGAELILVGHNEERLRAVSDEIARVSGNSNLHPMRYDLSSMADVRGLASDIKNKHTKLDVLINNVGIIMGERKLTVDEYEYTFALDHLAPFLLTNLLLEEHMLTAPSRIVTVSSGAHATGHMHFDDLMMEKGWTPFKSYSQAKLANVLFTYELARRLNGTGITANCLHPGGVRSNFGSNLGRAYRVGMALFRPFMISPEKGARTSIYLASSPDVENVTGKYFAKCQPKRSSKESYDLEEAKRLWEISEKLTSIP